MTALDYLRESREIVTALAALVAAVKAWLAERKAHELQGQVTEIKAILTQQQIQVQSQTQNPNITIVNNVGSRTENESITFSPEQP